MDLEPSFAELRRIISGFSLSMSIAAVAELGIADYLAAGPKTVSELAKLTGSDQSFLRRTLRYLASEGVFETRDGELFAQTPRSQWLRSDLPGSLRPRALFVGTSLNWTAWKSLPQSIRTGTPGIELALGQPLFEYLKSHSDAAAIFNSFMAQQTAASVEALLTAYDFAGVGKMVDVGGGQGALVAGVINAHPKVHGIVFDLPEVIAAASPFVERAGVRNRCTLIAGDFFESVPPGADLYVLKFILHDWPDAECVRILQNCCNAMPADGKLLVVEHVLPEDSGSDFSKFMDMNMLVLSPGGRERSRQEFSGLLGKAGLRLNRILPTSIGLYVMECKVA